MKRWGLFGLILVTVIAISGGGFWYWQKSEPKKQGETVGAIASVITLPKEIKAVDAVDAILAYREAEGLENLSDKDRKIIEAIQAAEVKMSDGSELIEKTESTTTLLDEVEYSRFSDRVIFTKDSEGNYLEPMIAKKIYELDQAEKRKTAMLEGASAGFEDNFVFSGKSTTAIKNIIYKAYGQIYSIMGERSYAYFATTSPLRSKYSKIQVVILPLYEVQKICHVDACYIPSTNAIYFPTDVEKRYAMIVHELTHAFQGLFAFDETIWCEGFATAVETIITETPDSRNLVASIEQTNLPTIDWTAYRFGSVEYPNYPYYYGQNYMMKFWVEDNEFFKNFSQKYYTQRVATLSDATKKWAEPEYIKIVIGVLPTIEGLAANDWFVSNFIFMPISPIFQDVRLDNPGSLLSNSALDVKVKVITGTPAIKYLTFNLYDHNNKQLGSYVKSNPPESFKVEWGNIVVGKTNWTNLVNYTGLVKLVIMIDANPAKSRIYYFKKYATSGSNYVGECHLGWSAAMIGGGDSAVLKKLDSNGNLIKSWTGKIKNGLACFSLTNDPVIQKMGVYRLVVTKNAIKAKGGKIVQPQKQFAHQFNLIANKNYHMVIRTEPDQACANCKTVASHSYISKENILLGRKLQVGAKPAWTGATKVFSATEPTGWGVFNFAGL
jgi:hypothetical protein